MKTTIRIGGKDVEIDFDPSIRGSELDAAIARFTELLIEARFQKFKLDAEYRSHRAGFLAKAVEATSSSPEWKLKLIFDSSEDAKVFADGRATALRACDTLDLILDLCFFLKGVSRRCEKPDEH